MIGDIYQFSIQGDLCGTPVACSFTYEQIQNLPNPEDSPGQALVRSWFSDANCPWLLVRPHCSNQLRWECAAYSSLDEVGATFLTNATGLSALPAMPSSAALMFHQMPASPWFVGPNQQGSPGRFYWPGTLVSQWRAHTLTAAAVIPFAVFGNSVINRPVAGGGVTVFRMRPHAKFITNPALPPGTNPHVLACWPDFLLRRIGSRGPNACAIFAAGGQIPASDSLVVPADPT